MKNPLYTFPSDYHRLVALVFPYLEKESGLNVPILSHAIEELKPVFQEAISYVEKKEIERILQGNYFIDPHSGMH